MDRIIAYLGTGARRPTPPLSCFGDPQKKLVTSLQVFLLCLLNLLTLTVTEIIRANPEFNRALVCPPGGCFYEEMPGPDALWHIAAILLILCTACAFVFLITAWKRCAEEKVRPNPSIFLKGVFLGYFSLAFMAE